MRLRKTLRCAWVAGVLVVTTSAAGCGRRALSVLVDLPEPTGRSGLQMDSTVIQALADTLRSLGVLSGFEVDTVRPPFESLLDPDSAVSLLPRDRAGNVDWVAAWETKVIKPRTGIQGEGTPERRDGFEFVFDFYLEGPDSLTDAYFPHSSHTEWVDCTQCHSRIFRYRGNDIGMEEIFEGKFCAECHGKVSFPVMSDCERCHTGMTLPPDRAQPELIGTITMASAAELLAPIGADTTSPDVGNKGFGTRLGLAPAQFPHWVHRSRYTCKTCHMDIFEPRAGSNAVTMDDIAAGRSCGRCHNGRVAFSAGFGECERCHVSPDAG